LEAPSEPAVPARLQARQPQQRKSKETMLSLPLFTLILLVVFGSVWKACAEEVREPE